MDRFFFKKISEGGLKGWAREDLLSLLPSDFFSDPISSIQRLGGEVIKDSRLRWAAIFSLSNGRSVFLKRDLTKGWIHSFKFLLLPSKGQKEWLIAYQSQKRNLNIPKPLGWMERGHWGFVKESYYLSEAIGSGVSLLDHFGQYGERVPIGELSKTVRKFHDSGLFHKDLHGGNILWDRESFLLVDLHRAKIVKSLSLNQRLWNLSQLFHSLRSLCGREDQMEFMDRYFEGEPLDPRKKEEVIQHIHSLMDSLQRRQWKSRTKRCLKESTAFSVQEEKGLTVYRRRDFPMDRLHRVIGDHLSLVKETPSALVKHSPEINVSLLKDGGSKICVKQFRYPRFWDRFKEGFRLSKGLRSWIAGNGLRTRGIPALGILAFVEKRKALGVQESFLLMEALETGQELDRYLFNGLGGFKKKRLFIEAFAEWLSRFHKMGLYHQDMKACNILVSEYREGWDFYFLDLEDILLDEKVDEKKVFKNFLQLHTSIPKSITRTDRLRFFKGYIRLQQMIRNEKNFIYRLMGKSRERGIVYVSPDGVVEEKLC